MLLVSAVLTSCVTNSDFNRLHAGMTKQDVLETVGAPDKTSVDYRGEVWEYEYLQPFKGSQHRELRFAGSGRLQGWN